MLLRQEHKASAHAKSAQTFFSATRPPFAERIMKPVKFAAATLLLLAIAGCAHVSPKPRASIPSDIKIEVEGWRAKITSLTPLDCLYVDFGADEKSFILTLEGSSSQLFPTGGKKAGSFYYPPFNKFSNILELSQDSLGKEELKGAFNLCAEPPYCKVYVPLSLVFPNRIRVSIIRPRLLGGGTMVAEKDTLVSSGKVYRVKKSGITILMESPGHERDAKSLVPILNELNRLLPKEDRIRHIILSNAGDDNPLFEYSQGFSMSLACSPLYAGTYAESIGEVDFVIFGSLGALADPQFAKIAVFHETAHAYFFKAATLDLLYYAFNNSYFYKAVLDSVPSADPKTNPAFLLLDEGSYFPHPSLPDSIYDLGHPYDNPAELFASTCTVLRFFPDEFFRRVYELNASDPTAASYAYSIAENVARAFGDRRVFPERVYDEYRIGK